MVDKAFEVRATEIPAMKVTYQAPIAPDGQGIAFELAIDSTVDRQELDQRLDLVIGAARRQAAVEELPRIKALIVTKQEALRKDIEGRAAALARQHQNVVTMTGQRRREAPARSDDVNAVAQFDARISETRQTIKTAFLRLPYLEAIIAGLEPPDMFPGLRDGVGLVEAAE